MTCTKPSQLLPVKMSKGDTQPLSLSIAKYKINPINNAFIPLGPLDLLGASVTLIIVVDNVEIAEINGVVNSELTGVVDFFINSSVTSSLSGDKTGESSLKITGAGFQKTRPGPDFIISETLDMDD